MSDKKTQGRGSERGFAAMDEKKQRDIASKGGQSVAPENRSFARDHDLAAEAGRKGGEASSGSQGSGSQGSEESGRRGGPGNFAEDPGRAADAGRKGGQSSRGR